MGGWGPSPTKRVCDVNQFSGFILDPVGSLSMSQTLFEQVRNWIHELTEPEADPVPEIDTDFLCELEYRYFTVKTDASSSAEIVRCDLCGRQYPLGEMPAAIEHVSEHNDHTTASIDPFEIAYRADEASHHLHRQQSRAERGKDTSILSP